MPKLLLLTTTTGAFNPIKLLFKVNEDDLSLYIIYGCVRYDIYTVLWLPPSLTVKLCPISVVSSLLGHNQTQFDVCPLNKRITLSKLSETQSLWMEGGWRVDALFLTCGIYWHSVNNARTLMYDYLSVIHSAQEHSGSDDRSTESRVNTWQT